MEWESLVPEYAWIGYDLSQSTNGKLRNSSTVRNHSSPILNSVKTEKRELFSISFFFFFLPDLTLVKIESAHPEKNCRRSIPLLPRISIVSTYSVKYVTQKFSCNAYYVSCV